MWSRFKTCTVHASTTELHHCNSGNAVRPNIPKAVSLTLQSPSIQHFLRAEGYAIHQNNIPTDTALQLHWLESSLTWLITPQTYRPFNNYLHVPCLRHSYIHWQSQTAWWHTAGCQSSSTCRLCIGSHDTECSDCGSNKTNTFAWILSQHDFTIQSVGPVCTDVQKQTAAAF